MAVTSLVWKLASPYDAYVSHVARLNEAIDRIRYFSEVALGHEAGLQGSVRYVPGGADAATRAARFRERLSTAAQQMGDVEFEEFLVEIGGGTSADVEAHRAHVVTRISHATRGLEEYFGIAGIELTTLEKRGYNPNRPDVARQLKENRLPATGLPAYRHELHELGVRVGKKSA